MVHRRIASILGCIAVAASGTRARAADPSPGTNDPLTSFDGTGAVPDAGNAQVQGEIASTIAEHVALDDGRSDVSPSGSFTYRHPIEVPPGIGGAQINLALAYDSHAEGGLLGAGFVLSGLPAIARVTGPVDGDGDVARGIEYDGHDSFAVVDGGWGAAVSPGDRLIPNGGGIFHTSSETWVQYQAFGHCGDDGFQPCAWIARDGRGNVAYFGGVEQAQLFERDSGQTDNGAGVSGRGVDAWALTFYRDRHGNSFRVDYGQDAFMMYPRKIEYGCEFTPPPLGPPEYDDSVPPPVDWGDPVEVDLDGDHDLTPLLELPPLGAPWVDYSPGSPTGNTVTIDWPADGEDPETSSATCDGGRTIGFAYEARPDATPTPSHYEQRLTAITVTAGDARLRSYELEYEQGPSGVSRLRELRKLGADQTSQLAPVRFHWSDGAMDPDGSTTQRAWSVMSGAEVETHVADIDGDGRDDLVRVAFSQDGRTVTYALGTATPPEANTPPLGATVTALDDNGDYRGWHSTIADIDRDGMDDLVMYRAWGDVGRIEHMSGVAGTAQTSPGLGGVVAYHDNAAIDDFVSAGIRTQGYYRLLVADTNGDQADDLVLVARHPDDDRRVALVLGDDGGTGQLAPVDERMGALVDGVPQPIEPVVADVDGDGLDDIVLTYVRVTGITSQIFVGAADEGLGDGQVLAWDAVAPPGVTPYQVLPGDYNGDGRRDITLAYTGQWRPIGQSVPIPHGRDIRTWLGQGRLDQLRRDASGRLVDEARNQVLTAQMFPYADPFAANPTNAFWQHHAGDIDGDGFTDVAMFHAGVGGMRAGYSLANPDGRLLAPDSITAGGCRVDAAIGTPCPAEPDGEPGVHRWQSRMADVDLDGRADLLAYYAGPHGIRVSIAHGTIAGLTELEPLIDSSTPVIPEHNDPSKTELAASVRLLAADLDGDGRPQLVLASADRVIVAGHKGPAAGEPTAPDVITRVENGFGGEVTVEHTPVAAVAGAIDPAGLTCGASTDDCGLAKRRSRPLVTRVARSNGLGLSDATRYEYRNGRYYPGPIVLGPGAVREHTRADLSFESILSRDETTSREVETWYRQDRPFERLVTRQQTRAEHGLFASTGIMTTRVRTFTHELRATPFGTSFVALVGDSDERIEFGFPQTRVDHVYDYTPFGGRRSVVECADGVCLETVTDFRPNDLAPERYLLNRPAQRRVHHQGNDYRSKLVLDWEKYGYDGEDLVLRRKLVCDVDTVCHCFDSADASSCVSAGSAHWIDVESDHAYDDSGRLLAVTDALGQVRNYEYDAQYDQPTAEVRFVDVAGVQTELRTSRELDAAGRVVSETDPNGALTEHEYDALGRIDTITWPGGMVDAWDYLDTGTPGVQRTRRTTTLGPNRARWREDIYDGSGAVVRTRVSDGDGGVITRARRELRTGNQRVLLVSDPYREGDALGQVVWIRIAHDGLDRVQSIEKVLGAHAGPGSFLGKIEQRLYFNGTTRMTNRAPLADDGSLVGEQWRATTVRNDSRGRPSWVYDEGAAADYWYNDAQHLWYISLDPNNFPGQANGGPFVFFSHDSLGRKIRSQDLSGRTLVGYDDLGNVRTIEDANKDVVTYDYDELGRVIAREDRDGVTTFTYDVGPNALGRLVEIQGPVSTDSSILFGFDERGNPHGRTITIDGAPAPFTETYAWDVDGRVKDKFLPDGTHIEYDHDTAGQLREVLVDGVSFASFDEYDAHGRPGLRITPASQTSFEYNADGVLRELVVEPEGSTTPVVAYRYAYDGQGNVREITDMRADLGGDVWEGAVDTEDTWSFTYDARNQLRSATDHLGQRTDYDYSPSGDITQRGDLLLTYSAREITGQIAGNDELTIVLDAMGQTIEKTDRDATWSYRYNGAGRIHKVERDGLPVAEYSYDGTGRQVRRSEAVDGESVTTFTPSPGYEVRVHSSRPDEAIATRIIDALDLGVVATMTDNTLTGAPKADAVYAAYGEAMIGSSAGGQAPGIWFHHANYLGSTTVVTDADGEVVARYRNDPWGVPAEGSMGMDVADREFTGQRRDETIALLDYGARYYDPSLGRFLTPDATDGGVALYADGLVDLLALNRTLYAHNNPVRYVDPSGHDDGDSIYESLVRRQAQQEEWYQNQEVEFRGEKMTMREFLRRQEQAAASKCGFMCQLERRWKAWRGADAELKLEFLGGRESGDDKLEYNASEGKGKVEVGGFAVETDGEAEVTVPVGPVWVSGTVLPDGSIEAKAGPKVEANVLGVKGEGALEVGANGKYVGDGKAKLQAVFEATFEVSVFEWFSLGVKLVGKDGSKTVDLPEVPKVRPRFNPASPNLRTMPQEF
jgi:RHS repeat-associated protein